MWVHLRVREREGVKIANFPSFVEIVTPRREGHGERRRPTVPHAELVYAQPVFALRTYVPLK